MTAVKKIALAAGLIAATAALAACGADKDGTATAATIDASKPVRVEMLDVKYDQKAMSVAAGTTVNFEFVNAGKLPHDAFIGDLAAQADHEKEMAAMAAGGEMNMHHSGEEGAVTVDPGATEQLTYTFTTPGTYEIGCHQPGHYGAGMKITINVV